MLNKIVLMWLLILISLACFAQKNTATLKYSPPFPDIWGYDLSEYPAFQEGGGIIKAYRMKDGDVWLLVDYSYKNKDPVIPNKVIAGKYILIKFFTGEKVILDSDEAMELLESIRDQESLIGFVFETVHFSDGSQLKRTGSGGPPKLCFVPAFGRDYFKKTFASGQVKKYAILGARPQVRMWHDDENYCEFQGAPFFYEKLYLFNSLVDLGDDTFLVFSSEGNLVLRFDKNLNTRFKPVTPTQVAGGTINRNFFVIDYALIEDLEAKYMTAKVPVFQTIHDELLKHFLDKYRA